jgi:hypothetical protein
MPKSIIPRQRVNKNLSEDWGDGALKNPLEFREWWKVLMRVWRPALTVSQFMVAAFIFDRTAAWGKEWEVITLRHFIDGVSGKDGACYAPGLGLSQPTVSAALASLCEQGLVRKRAVRNRYAYALNYEYNPENPMKLPVPKRVSNPQGVKESYTQVPKKVKNTFTLNCTKSIKRNVPKTPCPSSTDKDEFDMEARMQELQTLANATMAHTSSRRKVKQDALTPQGCCTLWMDACVEFHPDSTQLSLTQSDSAILRRFLVRAFGRDAAKARTFVRWLSEHWLILRAELFHWMQNTPPSVPSVRFTVKFSDKFEAAFAARDEYERLAALPLRDREVRTLMLRKGMTKAAAEAHVDAQHAQTVQAKETRKAAREAVQAANTLTTAQQRQRDADAAKRRWSRLSSAKHSATQTAPDSLPDFDSLPD